MTRKGRRLALIVSALGLLAVAAGLMAFAFRDNISLFLSPTELVEKKIAPGTHVRIGGMVKGGSLVRGANQHFDFVVTDLTSDLAVAYDGQLPDLFREGQGVVADGVLVSPGNFRADPNGVLAKHDEKYMPPEVAASLKRPQGPNGGEAMPGIVK